MAARYGNVDVVQYLCSIHANPNLVDRVGIKHTDTHTQTDLHYTEQSKPLWTNMTLSSVDEASHKSSVTIVQMW